MSGSIVQASVYPRCSICLTVALLLPGLGLSWVVVPGGSGIRFSIVLIPVFGLRCSILHFLVLPEVKYCTVQRKFIFPTNRNRNIFAEPTSVQIGIGILCELQNLQIGIGKLFVRREVFEH